MADGPNLVQRCLGMYDGAPRETPSPMRGEKARDHPAVERRVAGGADCWQKTREVTQLKTKPSACCISRYTGGP